MIYRILGWLVRLIVRVFYRKVEIHGQENVPVTGPLIFASNHPNMLLDPFMVGLVASDRRVHFLGKSTLFAFPPLGWLLRAAGVIPVYRRQDDPKQMGKNDQTFSACYEILGSGNVIGIFPEGVSERGPHLRPLKTGTARIVFEAEAKHDFALGIRVVPVGLNFPEGHLFRSDVLALVGPAIDPRPLHALYKEDAREAVARLTAEIEAGLEKITRNIKLTQDAEFIGKLERIYHEGYLGIDLEAPYPDLKHKFEVDQGIRDAYVYFLEQQPERVQRVRAMIENYLAQIEKLGLRDPVVGEYRGPPTLLKEAFMRLPAMLLASPLWLYGILTNYPPYRLTGIIANRLSTDVVEIATNKILMGTLLHILYYGALGWMAFHAVGPIWTLSFLVSFPLAGFIALELADRLRPFLDTWRAARTFLLHKDHGVSLRAEREKIVKELKSLTEEYQTRRRESDAANAPAEAAHG